MSKETLLVVSPVAPLKATWPSQHKRVHLYTHTAVDQWWHEAIHVTEKGNLYIKDMYFCVVACRASCAFRMGSRCIHTTKLNRTLPECNVVVGDHRHFINFLVVDAFMHKDLDLDAVGGLYPQCELIRSTPCKIETTAHNLEKKCSWGYWPEVILRKTRGMYLVATRCACLGKRVPIYACSQQRRHVTCNHTHPTLNTVEGAGECNSWAKARALGPSIRVPPQ